MHDPLVVAWSIRRPWPDLPPRDVRGPVREGCRQDPRWDWGYGRGRSWRPSPFVTLAGFRFYFPSLVTVWHVEPGGADSGEVCQHWRTVVDGPARERIRLAEEALQQARRDRIAALEADDAERAAIAERVLADAVAHLAKVRKGRRVSSSAWRWHVHHWRIRVAPLQQLRRRLLTRCAWCGGRDRKGDAVNLSHGWDTPPGRWWQGAPGVFHHWCSSAEIAWRTCTCRVPELAPLIPGHPAPDHGSCQRCGRFRKWRLDAWEIEQAEAWRRSTPYGTHPTREAHGEAVEIYQRAKAAGAAR